MISAIIEIVVLLTVSCLIGIYFTYRFWKSKYFELQTLDDGHKKDITKLHAEVSAAELKADRNEKNQALALDHQHIIDENSSKEQISAANAAQKVNKDKLKRYKKDVALLKGEMGEKERELEAVSKELQLRKISYYKHIDGKRYKAATLNMADEAIEGQGDGRISMADAEKIFDTISDGRDYTQVEKHTVKYLRDNYNWTEEADALFRTKVRSWAASDHELD